MLDKYTLNWIKQPLQFIVSPLASHGISANQVTVFGFFLGMLALPALYFQHYLLALFFIVLNRIADGVDGQLARQTKASNSGAFLDIVLDFVFYAAIVFGFALANPANALAASALLFGFMGTGSSFLAFSIMAERLSIKSTTYPNKGFYYLDGITEGTETILFFIAMCLFPNGFVFIAWFFAILCYFTTGSRIWSAYYTLKQQS